MNGESVGRHLTIGSVVVLFLKILLIAVGLVALSAGVILGEFYLVKKKNVFFGLIPSGALSLVSYLTLLIMVIAGAGWQANLITFFLLQIPIVAGVGCMIWMRRSYLQKQADERAREMRLQNARRMENEKQARMSFLLKGFRCAESSLMPRSLLLQFLPTRICSQIRYLMLLSLATTGQVYITRYQT